MLLGKHLNKYYLRYALFFIIGIIALIVIDYFQTLLPEYLGKLVGLFSNSVDGSIDMNVMNEMIISILILGVIMFVGRVGWRLSIFYAARKIDADMRMEMFKKAEKLPLSYYHDNKVGVIMTRFTTDLETIEEYLGWGTIMLVDAFFLSLIVIIKMIRVDYMLAIVALIPILLIVIWGALVEIFMTKKWQEKMHAYDAVSDVVQENVTGIRVIKAFVKETKELHKFAKVARRDRDVNISFVRLSIIFDVAISILIASIISLIMGIGGYMVYGTVTKEPLIIFGHKILITPESLVTFLGYIEILVWPMMALGQIYSMRSRAKGSLKRIQEFLDAPEDIKSKDDAINLENSKGVIEFKNFDFTFPDGNTKALKNISFTINSGESVGIVGKIGSGKSAIVSTLLRLYNLNQGQVFIDGHDIMDLSVESVRNNISYVPQDNFLFSDLVKNNIAFSTEETNMDKVIEAAKFADVHNNIVDFVEGYDTISGERGVTLSGGQKQRISIARAFYKDAPIMILDDSVSAVDVKTEENILKNIKNYRNGKTTIIIASRVSTISTLDKIVVLKDGEVEAIGTHDELLKSSKTYSRMVYLQELEKEVEGGNN